MGRLVQECLPTGDQPQRDDMPPYRSVILTPPHQLVVGTSGVASILPICDQLQRTRRPHNCPWQNRIPRRLCCCPPPTRTTRRFGRSLFDRTSSSWKGWGGGLPLVNRIESKTLTGSERKHSDLDHGTRSSPWSMAALTSPRQAIEWKKALVSSAIITLACALSPLSRS